MGGLGVPRWRVRGRSGYLSRFLTSIDQVVSVGQGTIIWFGAQFDRTLSRYKDGESLVWRDTGALIATISLVAECLNLNCCALVIIGEPHFSQLLNSKGIVIGVGGLLVGSK